MPRTPVYTGKAWEKTSRFSPGMIVSGRLLFTAGITARAPDGSLVAPNDMRRQAEQVVANLQAIYEAAGTDAGRMVKMIIFVTDYDAFAAARDAIAPLYVAKAPSTVVQVSRLADPAMTIEIETIVEVDPPSQE